jgi:hypothetical protein
MPRNPKMPSVVESLGAVAGVIAGVIATVLASYLWERRIRDRVTVRRIVASDDADTSGIIEIYSRLFPDDGTNYSAAELIDFTASGLPDRHVRVEDIVLAAKYHGDVVGFVFCHYYGDRRKAIISYFAIDEQVLEARRGAAAKMLKKLSGVLTDRKHPCEYLFFDLESPNSTLTKRENSERSARPVLFKQSAKQMGLRAHQFDFAYESPRISVARETRETPLILMCVPLAGAIGRSVPKATLLEFLRFIYFDCYGDLYPITDSRFKAHHDLLGSKFASYETALPETVRVF